MMPSDVTGDEIGSPDDGRGQAPPVIHTDRPEGITPEEWVTITGSIPQRFILGVQP